MSGFTNRSQLATDPTLDQFRVKPGLVMPVGTYFSHSDRFGGRQQFGWGYRNSQRAPYNRPLPYEHHTRTQRSFTSQGTWLVDASSGYDKFKQGFCIGDDDLNQVYITAAINDALNAAKNRFNDRATLERAMLGVGLAEARQSASMLERRANELGRLLGGILTRNPALCWGALADAFGHPWTRRQKRAGKGKKMPARTADAWLEWSFGWAPLVGDIQSAVEVFQSPVSERTRTDIRGRGLSAVEFTHRLNNVNYDWTTTHSMEIAAQCGATVLVTNENLNLANRLGFVNLASVGLELVPWSFVANWFFNLEETLKDHDALLGLSISDPYYSVRIEDQVSGRLGYRPNTLTAWKFDTVNAQSKSFVRYVGSLPSINLGVRPSFSFGLQRSANALALVTQMFSRFR